MKIQQRDYSEQHPRKKWYLARRWGVDPLITGKILFSRGITTTEQFNEFYQPTKIRNPLFLNDIEKAAKRIAVAIYNQQEILIFGDYDVDGIMATSLLYKGLKWLGAKVSFRVPLRSEGYGITPRAIERLIYEDHAKLIVTVDNGSTAHEAMEFAKTKGIDVIVTDHHNILGGRYPSSYAFVNPKRFDSRYGFDDLCGAGVALNLLEAIFLEWYGANGPWKMVEEDYLELACLGTIADVMPLVDENRRITRNGLYRMRSAPSEPLQLLFKAMRMKSVELSGESIAFQIAPIFNACGRISDPNFAVRFLTSEHPTYDDARKLLRVNEDRKRMTAEHIRIADQIITENNLRNQRILVVSGPFHEGLIGLVAGRLSDRYKMPSIVIAEHEGKGSARSGPGSFSIVNVIEKCAPLLKKFGGHQAAAGITVDPGMIAHFAKEIQQYGPTPGRNLSNTSAYYDWMIDIGNFPDHLRKDLEIFEPFGHKNEKPLFYSPNTRVKFVEAFGKYEKHLAFKITQAVRASAFFRGEQLKEAIYVPFMDFIYSPSGTTEFIIKEFEKSQFC